MQVELIVGDAVLVVDGDRAAHGEGQAGVLVVPPEARGPQVRAMPLLQGVMNKFYPELMPEATLKEEIKRFYAIFFLYDMSFFSERFP